MRVLGVDFTSRPRAGKPITCVEASLRNRVLSISGLRTLRDFAMFEGLLREPGPWVGGFDFPFGLPRSLLEALRWPTDWAAYVKRISEISREEFRALLDAVRMARPIGARYLHRATDLPVGASSPMKLVNPPVGLMFYEGAQRLLASGVSVMPCASGDAQRVALEAYPGVLARQFTRQSYKSDERRKQTPARRAARRRILDGILDPEPAFGFAVDIAPALIDDCVDDGSGDTLDAVLCALQAAWACCQARGSFGIPDTVDSAEGWIVGPRAGNVAVAQARPKSEELE